MTRAREELQRWYSDKVPVPKSYSGNVVPFIVNSIGIIAAVLDFKSSNIRVRVTTEQTFPYANQENKTIVIPIALFSGDPLPGKLHVPPVEDALATIMGVIVHEALHFKHSPATIDEALAIGSIPNNSLSSALLNLVEDVYIEDYARHHLKNIFWTVEVAWEFLLNEPVGRILGKPKTAAEVEKAVNYLIAHKNRNYICDEYSEEETWLIEKLYSVDGKDVLRDRLKIAKELYEWFAQDLSEEEIEQMGDPVDGDGDGKNKDASSPDEDDYLSMSRSARALSEERINAQIIAVIENNDEYVQVDNVIVYRHTPPFEKYYHEIKPDERYERLSTLSAQRAAVNRPIGEARSSGTRIKRVHRIATDSKIFAEPMKIDFLAPQEIIIFVDCSGSMLSRNKILRALAAAYGAAKALEAGRHKVAVYGHSADTHLANWEVWEPNVVIYKFKDFDERTHVLTSRMSSFYEASGNLANNRDGDAILAVSKLFTKSNNSKKLIVISDGLPSAEGYAGQPAMEHTRSSVNAIRRRGIAVVSISIERDAVYPNDFIYGETHNVYNSDPNVIEQLIHRLLTKGAF